MVGKAEIATWNECPSCGKHKIPFALQFANDNLSLLCMECNSTFQPDWEEDYTISCAVRFRERVRFFLGMAVGIIMGILITRYVFPFLYI